MLTGILLTAGSIGVMCGAGATIATALKWFNNYEFDTTKKGGGSRSHSPGGMGMGGSGGPRGADRVADLRNKMKHDI